MIIIITGASHTGKTILATKMAGKYNYPSISIDLLKMGLIRSGYTDLTPLDDDKLTSYLWPVVREMIKTAVENGQDLIVEGCYIPFDWRKDLEERYLKDIRFICLAMTDRYIDDHFDLIREHASDIKSRLDDSDCTIDRIRQSNREYIEGFEKAGEKVTYIEEDYVGTTDSLL
ncbi:MAG: adenylate kinase [Clostridiales bacterium]|nr:adenylate kinase [Clostridiales bacterium]